MFTACLLNVQDSSATAWPGPEARVRGSKRQKYISAVLNRLAFRHRDHKLTVPTHENRTSSATPRMLTAASYDETQPHATVRLFTPNPGF